MQAWQNGIAAAGIEDPGADPAGRGKYERGQRLAHPAKMGPNGIGEPGHDAPSLPRPRS